MFTKIVQHPIQLWSRPYRQRRRRRRALNFPHHQIIVPFLSAFVYRNPSRGRRPVAPRGGAGGAGGGGTIRTDRIRVICARISTIGEEFEPAVSRARVQRGHDGAEPSNVAFPLPKRYIQMVDSTTGLSKKCRLGCVNLPQHSGST